MIEMSPFLGGFCGGGSNVVSFVVMLSLVDYYLIVFIVGGALK